MRYALILGVLFAATTGNAQWEIQPAPTTSDLRGIDNVGKGIAWASGSDGTVLRTIDDGKDWQLCPIPPGAEKLDFRGIQAFDEKTAIVMSTGKGPLSRLYKTTDGCQTWKLVFTNPDSDGSWAAIQFRFHDGPSPNYRFFNGGVFVGDPVDGRFPIFTTSDYGSTWQPLKQNDRYRTIPPAVAKTGESLFDMSNSAITATADDDTFAFVTGGTGGAHLIIPHWHGWSWCSDCFGGSFTFSEIQLPISSNETSGAFSIASRRTSSDYNRVDLMIVGGDYKRPEVGSAVFVRHSDSPFKGLFSRRVIASTTPPHGFRSAVAYDAATKTWITVGPNGTDVSTDDGRNWRALRPNPALHEPADADRDWNALSLPFVVGPHGRIGKLRPEALK